MGSRLDGQRRQKSVSPARPSFFSFDRGGSGGRGKLDSRHSVKTKLIMVFLEQFGAVEESNGTVYQSEVWSSETTVDGSG